MPRSCVPGSFATFAAAAFLIACANPAGTQESCSTAISDLNEFIACGRRAESSREARCASAPDIRLALPVAGPRMVNFGDKTQYGSTSKGVVIDTEPGAIVQAPLGGVILHAGEWRTYGHLIVLDACTVDVVIAGVRSSMVQAGSTVQSGETIARMDDRLGQVLYFEVRASGKAIDPTPLLQDK